MPGRRGLQGAFSNDLTALHERLKALKGDEAALNALLDSGLWPRLGELYEKAPPKPLSCLACGHTAMPLRFGVREDVCVFGGGPLKRHECPRCGCVFGPRWYLEAPAHVIEADYRRLYQGYQEADSTEDEVRAFHLLEPRSDGVYLNWGSGDWSRSVPTLRKQGWNVWGYEPYARTETPFTIRDHRQFSEQFDGIFSNNVIEHFFEPAGQFADIRRILKPGGRMVHASPCYDWAFAFTRFHVFFPMGRAPECLASRTRFCVESTVKDANFAATVFGPPRELTSSS